MPVESELFKDKIEVSLDSRQIFYVFFGGAVIVAMVFVLGIMVGKRVEARAQLDRPASPERDPLAALDALGHKDELAFPTALAGHSGAGSQASSPLPLGSVDEEVLARAKSNTDKSKNSKNTERTKNSKKTSARAKKSVPERVAARPAQRAHRAAKPPSAQASAETDAAATKPAAKKPGEPAARAAAGPSRTEKPRSRFTLQLSSFRARAEADSFYNKLKDAGYEPYVIEAEVPGKGTWYRVRLGHYGSYEKAIEAKKTFEDDLHIIAYVTRLKN